MSATFPPRDLVGYARNPPHPNWPGGARVAVNFCINYEEGGERSLVNGDATSEDRISDLVVQARLGARDFNMESCYEFGSRVGFWRLMRAFQDRSLPATVNLVGLAGALNPYALEAIAESGFDIHPHGWRWIDHHGLPIEVERQHIAWCVEQAVSLTGEHPLGYYAGMPSVNTRRLVAEDPGFLYDSDNYSDELPFWNHDHGRPLLILPYSLDTNDSRFSRREGFQLAEEFERYVKDSFDQLYLEGERAPRMLTVGLHARLLGRPGRIGSLHRLLDYMMGHDQVWICRRSEIALHWAKQFPCSAVD